MIQGTSKLIQIGLRSQLRLGQLKCLSSKINESKTTSDQSEPSIVVSQSDPDLHAQSKSNDQSERTKEKLLHGGPSLAYFIADSETGQKLRPEPMPRVPYLSDDDLRANGRKVYFDVHGCQMNTNDTEIAWSVLQEKGYQRTLNVNEADVVLVMTCAIREGAEQKIWKKLKHLALVKRRKPLMKGGETMKIGILGCMAERLKTKILDQEKMVDVVCGPDAYRDLPRLLANTHSNQTAVNVLLSLDETYADVVPVRLNENTVTAYVSIMRGCDNMCSYCIVPFTRGRERSRPIDTIVNEVRQLSQQGVKEVTLLGQNVNSYRDLSQSSYYGNNGMDQSTQLSEGFKTIYKTKAGGRRFADLLEKVANVDPEMRIRFTAPHPKDFPDEVLQLIKDNRNICNQLHLPAQSGNSDVLAAMRRGYTREAYLALIDRVKLILPDCAITSDFISGFCGETELAHKDTIDLLHQVKYTTVWCYPYSMRQKTNAYHKLVDDVPEDVKSQRFREVADVFRQEALNLNLQQIGKQHLVLVEGKSKRSDTDWFGRNDAGVGCIIPDMELFDGHTTKSPQPGDYLLAKIHKASSQTLHGNPLRLTTLKDHRSWAA